MNQERKIPVQSLDEMAKHWVRLGILDPIYLQVARQFLVEDGKS